MNYDFSEKEQAFISAVEASLGDCVEKAGPRDLEAIDRDLRQALQSLCGTGYTGLGNGADAHGTQTLFAAMEKVAGLAPSAYLGIEMNCRLFGRLLAAWADARPLKSSFPRKSTNMGVFRRAITLYVNESQFSGRVACLPGRGMPGAVPEVEPRMM